MLLLDEPFGALDALTRGVIQDELVRICAATHQTGVHDHARRRRIDPARRQDRADVRTAPTPCVAEIVHNTVAQAARPAHIHHDPQYYRIRNHLVDFSSTARSSTRAARRSGRAAPCEAGLESARKVINLRH
jgi:nitrate/nitrite transport system ATP-binding protein